MHGVGVHARWERNDITAGSAGIRHRRSCCRGHSRGESEPRSSGLDGSAKPASEAARHPACHRRRAGKLKYEIGFQVTTWAAPFALFSALAPVETKSALAPPVRVGQMFVTHH